VRIFRDGTGTEIRLTDERREHIERRREMENQLDRIEETVQEPDELRVSEQDETVRLITAILD